MEPINPLRTHETAAPSQKNKIQLESKGGRDDDYHDQHFNPDKKISRWAGFMHVPQAISNFYQLPNWIKDGCIKHGNINKFNKLQKSVMCDLCLGNDSIIISPAGSGKTISIIMSSFYRLYSKKAPAHIMLIAVDHIHVEILRQLCIKFGKYVPDLNVIQQVRGCLCISNKQLGEGRNIFICTPGKAINLCKNGNTSLTHNLQSVTIFDCDTLLVNQSWIKIKNIFKCIPIGMNVNFISSSMCTETKQNIKQLVEYNSPNTKKHILTNDYDNLKFWRVFCGKRRARIPMLNELCKVNPYKQGVIFCSSPQQARIIQHSLNYYGNDSFKSEILASETVVAANQIISLYNSGATQYIIAHEYSPIHMLYQLDTSLLKIIINFQLTSPSTYLKRANIGKYISSAKKIHVISLIDKNQIKVYEQVEELDVCKIRIQLIELPSNVEEVLIDDKQLSYKQVLLDKKPWYY